MLQLMLQCHLVMRCRCEDYPFYYYCNIYSWYYFYIMCPSHNYLLLLTLFKFWNTLNMINCYRQIVPFIIRKLLVYYCSIIIIIHFSWKHFIINLCISISIFHFWSNDFHENRFSIKLSTSENPSSQLI